MSDAQQTAFFSRHHCKNISKRLLNFWVGGGIDSPDDPSETATASGSCGAWRLVLLCAASFFLLLAIGCAFPMSIMARFFGPGPSIIMKPDELEFLYVTLSAIFASAAIGQLLVIMWGGAAAARGCGYAHLLLSGMIATLSPLLLENAVGKKALLLIGLVSAVSGVALVASHGKHWRRSHSVGNTDVTVIQEAVYS